MIMAPLCDVFNGVPHTPVAEALEISGLSLDSRKIAPGDLFVANSQQPASVASFVDQAFRLGAVAGVIDEMVDVDAIEAVDMPIYRVPLLREQVGRMAANYYGQPSNNMLLVGVTGTNGKTTCAYMLAELLNALGTDCGYVGTLGAGLLNDLKETGFTTPLADGLQQQLYQFNCDAIRAAAIEVSSHGLEEHRVDATKFDIAVLTNLSRDHLDYHESMVRYGAAKARIFQLPGVHSAIINVDDEFGFAQAQEQSERLNVLRISIDGNEAEFSLSDITASRNGFQATLCHGGEDYSFSTPLLGRFNLYNILLVVAAATAAGYGLDAVLAQVPMLKAPPGRMEQISGHQASVVIDYAHSPDALKNVCEAARENCKRRLLLVFGCGGDRDAGKRPEMGTVAAECADVVVLTDDNPRTEKSSEILEQILSGVPFGASVFVEPDRAKAIGAAIQMAELDDCIIIAGKGHEAYQLIEQQRLPFSDAAEAQKVLRELSL